MGETNNKDDINEATENPNFGPPKIPPKIHSSLENGPNLSSFGVGSGKGKRRCPILNFYFGLQSGPSTVSLVCFGPKTKDLRLHS